MGRRSRRSTRLRRISLVHAAWQCQACEWYSKLTLDLGVVLSILVSVVALLLNIGVVVPLLLLLTLLSIGSTVGRCVAVSPADAEDGEVVQRLTLGRRNALNGSEKKGKSYRNLHFEELKN